MILMGATTKGMRPSQEKQMDGKSSTVSARPLTLIKMKSDGTPELREKKERREGGR
jgi:hypothetical protein